MVVVPVPHMSAESPISAPAPAPAPSPAPAPAPSPAPALEYPKLATAEPGDRKVPGWRRAARCVIDLLWHRCWRGTPAFEEFEDGTETVSV